MSQQTQTRDPVVTFNNNPVFNEAKSKKAGRPIFDDMEVCEIRFPGDTKCWACFPAHEAEPNKTRETGQVVTYAEVYNKQYLQFKSQQQQTVSGTPLSEAPFLTEGKRRELRALNIHTVEALAALDGAHLRTLGMGGREWKNQAQAFLDRAAGSADVTAMATEIARLKERAAAYEAELAALRSGPLVPVVDAPTTEEKGDKALEDCTDEELRAFIVAEGGKLPPRAKRAALVELATELATREVA